VAHCEDAWIIEPVEGPVEDPVAVVTSWRPKTSETRDTHVEGFLSGLGGHVSVHRALAHIGLSRSRIDRFLAQNIRVCSRRGPVVGGLHPGWFRMAGDRAVALRWRDASPRGWWALDLAAVGLFLRQDLSGVHQEGLEQEAEAADLAYRLCSLHVALREAILDRSAAAEEVALHLYEGLAYQAPTGPVQVHIEGPDWLDTSAWLPEDGKMDAHQARWLLRNLDGIWVAGHTLQVTTTPPIRAGKGAPRREDRSTRNQRLFSRWYQGIHSDEEGLFSVTPEALALQMVEGLEGVIMDGTCGIGGLTIALAQQEGVEAVIAVDIEIERIKMARHNAGLYPNGRKIRFLHSAVEDILKATKPDVLVLDPPWGGRNYDRTHMGISDLGMNLLEVLQLAPETVLLKLPRSFDVSELPGEWTVRALVDDRGILKFLSALRTAAPAKPAVVEEVEEKPEDDGMGDLPDGAPATEVESD
jgi:trimethylguanosine synthase